MHTLDDASTRAVVVPWTAKEMAEQCEAFDLRAWNVHAGDRVALLVPNGPRAAVCLLAAMRRYCVVPLNPAATAEQIAAALERTGSRCMVSFPGDKVLAACSSAQVTWVRLEASSGSLVASLSAGEMDPSVVERSLDQRLGMLSEAQDERLNTLDDTVLVLQTSGTTSQPKLVPFTLRRLLASGSALAQSMQLGADDVGLNMMPLHHVGGIACNLLAPLVAQSRMVFTAWSDAAAWFRHVEAAESGCAVTWCYAAPTMWLHIVRFGESQLLEPAHTMRLLRSGAAPLPHSEAVRLTTLFGSATCILPTYSMTVRAERTPNPVSPLPLLHPRAVVISSVGMGMCIATRIRRHAHAGMYVRVAGVHAARLPTTWLRTQQTRERRPTGGRPKAADCGWDDARATAQRSSR